LQYFFKSGWFISDANLNDFYCLRIFFWGVGLWLLVFGELV